VSSPRGGFERAIGDLELVERRQIPIVQVADVESQDALGELAAGFGHGKRVGAAIGQTEGAGTLLSYGPQAVCGEVADGLGRLDQAIERSPIWIAPK